MPRRRGPYSKALRILLRSLQVCQFRSQAFQGAPISEKHSGSNGGRIVIVRREEAVYSSAVASCLGCSWANIMFLLETVLSASPSVCRENLA